MTIKSKNDNGKSRVIHWGLCVFPSALPGLQNDLEAVHKIDLAVRETRTWGLMLSWGIGSNNETLLYPLLVIKRAKGRSSSKCPKSKWSHCGASFSQGQIPQQEAHRRNSDRGGRSCWAPCWFLGLWCDFFLSFLDQTPFQLGITAAKNKVVSV